MESQRKLLNESLGPMRLFVGPLFLITSLSLALIKGAVFTVPLFIFTALGLVGSLLFALYGALSMGALLLGYFFLFRSALPAGTHLWHLGFFTTLILGFVIMSLSLEDEDQTEAETEESEQESLTLQLENRLRLAQEKSERFSQLAKECDLQVQALFRENEALKGESIEQRRQIESLKRHSHSADETDSSTQRDSFDELCALNHSLQKMVEEKEGALKRAEGELSALEHELKLISSRGRGFFAAITAENFQKLQQERESLLRAHEELELECELLEEQMAAEPPDLDALRWQHDEKRDILQQTKAELFRTEADLLTYQRLLGEKTPDHASSEAKLIDLWNLSRRQEVVLTESTMVSDDLMAQNPTED